MTSLNKEAMCPSGSTQNGSKLVSKQPSDSSVINKSMPKIWFYDDTTFSGIRNLTYYNNTESPLMMIMYCELPSNNKTNGSMSIVFKKEHRNTGLRFGQDIISQLRDVFINIIMMSPQVNKIEELITICEYKDPLTPYHFNIKLTDPDNVMIIISTVADLLMKYNLIPTTMKDEIILLGTKTILKFIQ